ncbi:hypothetical protein THRCLA_04525 [Thraustotheca clavata]|uniref:Polymerase nucleotidyl transferase domain-containing protein n=1 Tax=Thraustotheca clavata TaxID=74557 RepID=A0A1V9ZYX9_9STRA|nr:hypothetical protein THRCLA_04525 [Thraustotheca clavata]
MQRRRLQPSIAPKKKPLGSKNVAPPKKKEKDARKNKKPRESTLGAWVLPTIEPDMFKRKKQSKPVVQNEPVPVRGVKQPSWQDREADKNSLPGNLYDSLHKEIVEYSRYTKTIVAEMAVHIEKTIDMVKNCVRKLWPEATVETYGSYSTGIWLPSSDIDLVILGVGDPSQSPVVHLKRLATQLRGEKWVESILMVDTAKIPLLKLVSLDSSVPIDITFESANTHSGLLARDLIKGLVEEMPELYPLAVVFKQLLRERGLNDCYTGGISSYSIVLMIVHLSQLWRAGPTAFNAAMIYASGSLPTEAITIDNNAQEETKKPEDVTPLSALPLAAATAKKGSPLIPSTAPTVKSYASVVETEPLTTLSYAAVAVGSSSYSKGPRLPSTPSSYASMKQSSKEDHLESVSVASSQADTEDTSADEREDPEQSQFSVCLGAHVLRIFEYFGCIFNYQKSGLSIRNGGFIFRLHDEGPSPFAKYNMVIEDPIHPERNVSAASFAYQKVVALFEDSYFALKYFRPTRYTPTPLSCLLSCAGHRGVHRRLMYHDEKDH